MPTATRKRPFSPTAADPSRTGILRNAFSAELRRRITKIERELRKMILEEDVFGLYPPPIVTHGGSGSGNFGHVGRPGLEGGSAKQRGIETLTFDNGYTNPVDIPVFVNPTLAQAKDWLRKYGEIRGVYNPNTRDLYIWDAKLTTHKDVADYLGLDWDAIVRENYLGRFVAKSEGQLDIRWGPEYQTSNYLVLHGGPGSGNFGHTGRPGLEGGSAKESSGSEEIEIQEGFGETSKLRVFRNPAKETVLKLLRRYGVLRGLITDADAKTGLATKKSNLFVWDAYHSNHASAVVGLGLIQSRNLKGLVWDSPKAAEEGFDRLGSGSFFINNMVTHGGVGSGNFGHAGRPGLEGGSAPNNLQPVKMSAADASIIEAYQENSYEINGSLRDGIGNAPIRVQKFAIQLKKVFEKYSVPLPEDMVLYRGIDDADLPHGAHQEMAFTSTTTDPQSAGFFGENVMELYVSKGTKVLPILGGKEQEVLLPQWKYFSPTGERTTFERRGQQLPLIKYTVNALVTNQRWKFLTNPQKLSAFTRWLKQRFNTEVLLEDREFPYWRRYVEQGYEKGAGRAFDDVKRGKPKTNQRQLDFYRGTREQFLRQSFGTPESIEKVKLLASRVLTELQGVSQDMATRMSRTLTDGLVQGQNPRKIAKTMSEDLAIGKNRAEAIARTEVIRAHSEGQLDAFERLGVEELGVSVEWSTAGDSRVCPKCYDLEGIVLTPAEAHGLIPRHTNCRCAFKPAGVGEDPYHQLRTKRAIDSAIKASIAKEIPKKSNRTVAEQIKLSKWTGADKVIGKKRPKPVVPPVTNVFCPTGPGGGIDPTCSPGEVRVSDKIGIHPQHAKTISETLTKLAHKYAVPVDWIKVASLQGNANSPLGFSTVGIRKFITKEEIEAYKQQGLKVHRFADKWIVFEQGTTISFKTSGNKANFGKLSEEAEKKWAWLMHGHSVGIRELGFAAKIATHEFGHVLQHRVGMSSKEISRQLTPDESILAKTLSTYATTNYGEFLAEAFVAKEIGRTKYNDVLQRALRIK